MKLVFNGTTIYDVVNIGDVIYVDDVPHLIVSLESSGSCGAFSSTVVELQIRPKAEKRKG